MKTVSVIGGGASSLMLACELDPKKYCVSIFEKNNALGRKFLVAGEGGFNLTHSENEKDFISKYTPSEFLKTSFSHFSNTDFINWLYAIGIETFVGSSGRVFPKKGIKPIDVLKKIEDRIKNKHVKINYKHEWIGFSHDDVLYFKTPNGTKEIKSDIIIFCLGGASWPVTGSSGNWLNFFTDKNISVVPFKASNCSFKIEWPEEIIRTIEGKPLKNISISCDGKINFGEVVLTAFGMEGSGIYPLSPQIREALEKKSIAKVFLDLKPLFSHEECLTRVSMHKAKLSYTENIAMQLNLNKVQIALIKAKMNKEEFLDPVKVVNNLKSLEIIISALGPIEDAISTVGGISLNELSGNFELKKMTNCFAVGEMLDYDAPTGGYLLQSCFSMAKFLSDKLNSIQ